MGWLRKKMKQLGRGIKKLGKKIGKAFKGILKPFAKVFGKLGPLGSMAMMMILPGIGQLMAGWGASLGTGIGTAIKFVGNAINYVASAPQKIFSTITNGIGAGWNALTGASSATGGSWFTRFRDAFKESWNDPTRDINSLFKFDYSAEGLDRIANIQAGKGNLLGYVPEAKVTTPTTEGTVTPESKGLAGKVKDLGKKEIPVLGTVGDVASVGSTALGTYSTLLPYVASEDDPYGVGGGMTIRAEEQLYGGDQGGMYNITPPTWSYDYNQSFTQNQQNSRNVWNNAYGLPEGFDSASMGGYGFGYDQWFMEAMGFRPIR